MLSVASSNNMMVQEPYKTQPESLQIVLAELGKLQNVGEAYTYSIQKSCDDSGNINLFIQIKPIVSK